MIIAIDGPAGSGKSSTAREIARRLDALFIDTGAMYRAMALKALQESVDPEETRFADLVLQTSITLDAADNATRVVLDNQDVTGQIRSEDVSSMSSRVSKRGDVRQRMVELQRTTAMNHVDQGGVVVMEGRDIGTVVFPDADFKFFITATDEVRAQRRSEQLRRRGEAVDESELLQEIRRRDARDSQRDESPLRRSKDAVLIDTSDISFEEQVENILSVISGNEAV